MSAATQTPFPTHTIHQTQRGFSDALLLFLFVKFACALACLLACLHVNHITQAAEQLSRE